MSHGNKSYRDTYYHPGGGGTQFITFYIWTKYSWLRNFLCWISYCFDFSHSPWKLSICPWNAFVDININLRGENLRVHKIDDCPPLCFVTAKSVCRGLPMLLLSLFTLCGLWTSQWPSVALSGTSGQEMQPILRGHMLLSDNIVTLSYFEWSVRVMINGWAGYQYLKCGRCHHC